MRDSAKTVCLHESRKIPRENRKPDVGMRLGKNKQALVKVAWAKSDSQSRRTQGLKEQEADGLQRLELEPVFCFHSDASHTSHPGIEQSSLKSGGRRMRS